ncbi:choice-of-anchor A family protein [Janthinobacterium agaricidamnosum]|uniref:PEP-CTERM putative exosortase interaction domain protein n=1 Tax=Janthinobacterium agaricidamnosum NBRC 102515 = DSM 9628 TaxID=1349767 RepID=W0VBM6_9BURK|nr:choice-of-anchor A family protein [Janthinobacterium agaricidamnosum]CDG85010.1 PEP-CTERM putative exosortase interaction domain protein [Janthinobacterium agaricidamnosum NBRC 102515 = DSM 9628]
MIAFSKIPAVFLLSTILTTGLAQAGVVDLNIGGANVYTLGNFSSGGSQVGGTLLVAGNMNVSNSYVNIHGKNKDGDSAFSLAVGGDLNFNSGSVGNAQRNDMYYVGGNSRINNSASAFTSTKSTTPPLSFADTSAHLKNVSTSLSTVASTGSSKLASNGRDLNFTGSGSGKVQVFNVSGYDLRSASTVSFYNTHAYDTIIVNVSGKSSGFSYNVDMGSSFIYNLLFNFYEATDLAMPQSMNLSANLLAPSATLWGGAGNIEGNVVVGNWNSNMTTTIGNNAFKPVDVPGLISPVPEPESYAMWLAGLGLLGCVARRKAAKGKQAAA